MKGDTALGLNSYMQAHTMYNPYAYHSVRPEQLAFLNHSKNFPMQATIVPKQEPMEEDRNDSGFNSCSPGSDHSNENQQYPPLQSNIERFQIKEESSNSNMSSELDPLQHLQITMNKKAFLPGSSPQSSEHCGEDDKRSELEKQEYDDTDTPRINSHGKMKTFKCKYCSYIGVTKHAYWEHLKLHIKEDKRLSCPSCGFITEYKHHLEYHMRNHDGSKPFKCTKCSYSCVNKSMLSSHMKSHSNVYQYRCANCSYATKYCHSLKLHLRKYDHQPDVVLNTDGTPNPLPIIDVYGTRRGPKQKSTVSSDNVPTQMPPSAWSNSITQLMMNPMQLPFPYHLLANLPLASDQNQAAFLPSIVETLRKQLNTLQNDQNNTADFEANSNCSEEMEGTQGDDTLTNDSNNKVDTQYDVLDLSVTPKPFKINRRKGPAFKLENLRPHSNNSSDEDENENNATITSNISSKANSNLSTTFSPTIDSRFANTSPSNSPPLTIATEEDTLEERNNNQVCENNNDNGRKNFTCKYCHIDYQDETIFIMHMGYHSFHQPFTCNMCGMQCKDKFTFNSHILTVAHHRK